MTPAFDDDADTLPGLPRGLPSLLPPRMPSDIAPYEVPHVEVALGTFGAAGALSALYLGAEFAHHWQIGGWVGVTWLATIALAAGLMGGTIAMCVILWRLRRG